MPHTAGRFTFVSALRAAVALAMIASVLVAVQGDAEAATLCFGQPATTRVRSSASGSVSGTPGDDVIVGAIGWSSVKVYGGGGNDRICVHSPGGPLSIYGQGGRDKIRGDRATLFGGGGNDTLIDWYGSGALYGGAGHDRLFGKAGSGDHLFGGSGDDYLHVGEHGGYAYGGPGSDECGGGKPLYEASGCESKF